MHAQRPGVCRAYRCAWLGGAFGDADRPDRLGAVLDLVPRATQVHLVVRLARGGSLESSPRLEEIVAEARRSMPVEIRDADDVLDADRPYRVLHPNGEEHRVAGHRLEIHRAGRPVEARSAPWLERGVARLRLAFERWRLRRWPTHDTRLAQLGLPTTPPPQRQEEEPEER